MRSRTVPTAVYPALILLANLLIVRKLFVVEYTRYLITTEGIVIALARGVAEHPLDLLWWPYWDCGEPFVNGYSPLLGILAGLYRRIAGLPEGLTTHRIAAAAFCLSPLFLYFLAWAMTKRPGASFLAALAYTTFSPCVWMLPVIRQDVGGWWNLRRLQILVVYGESPHISAFAFVPLAILCLYLAVSRKPFWPGVGAGIAMGAAMLTNAFAAVIMGIAGFCLLVTVAGGRFWKYLGFLLVTGGLTYAWVSPLSPPSVLAAIRLNSPTVDGDYRFTLRSAAGVLILIAGFALMRWILGKIASPSLQFFWLFTFLTGGIVFLGVLARIYVVPQPHRYQIAMDMGIWLAVVFSGAEWLRSKPGLLRAAAATVLLLCAIGIRKEVRYARGLMQPLDVKTTPAYRIAQQLEERLPGQRVMIPGSYSLFANSFTDVPQLLGGTDPMLPNFTMRVAGFVIYSGMGTGARDGEISILWLKALGARAVVMSGPEGGEYYKPFANPSKFDGLLPVLWSEAGDTVYSVPVRSASLAHVLPQEKLVRDVPVNGIDVGEIEAYVKAMDDPGLPLADFQWTNRHSAVIHARMGPGQALSVQVTHTPGWRAQANGASVPVEKDGLGLIRLKPNCQGDCEITLTYDGGTELRLTLAASVLTMLGVVGWATVRTLRT